MESDNDSGLPPSQATVTNWRIESALNGRLGDVLPVIYGAVLSYGLWVLAQLIIRYQANFVGGSPSSVAIDTRAFVGTIAVFLCIIVFLTQELGEISKYNSAFPMRRTSRYSVELAVAAFYLSAFALVEQRNLLAWIAFAIAIGLGGLWFNQFKEEYPKAAHLARTMRALHYFGAFVFVGEAALMMKMNESLQLDGVSALVFGITFVAWSFAYAVVPALRHGKACNDYLVNVQWPDRWILEIQTRHDGVLTEEA